MTIGSAAHADSDRDLLFVGDGVDNKVEVFDAITGTWRRSLHPKGLLGPRGIVRRSGNLFLVNQNVDTDFTGEVLRFNANGPPLNLKRVVPAGTPEKPNPDAPFAPRGMIRWNNHLFVANVCDPCLPPEQPGGGGVLKYTTAGVKVGVLRSGQSTFHPFGLVIGPDGLLYVSSRPNLFAGDQGGQVLQFDPETGNFIKTFISSSGGRNRLNGPEGLVFGPDGRLYITSFRARDDDQDTDKILIYEGPRGAHPGARVGKIDLDQVGEKRATAQTLLFGPGGDLFVPISNVQIADPTDDQGAIRRYRIGCTPTATRKCFTYFVCPSAGEPGVCPPGKLGQGWYLTFGETRPGTLTYDD
jgi:DNA-binding beta-propeller fold protein YncE